MVEPESLTILSGQSARFNCCTAATTPWEIMLWHLDDTTVMIITREIVSTNTTVLSAVNYSTPEGPCWEMTIEHFTRGNATRPRQVSCEIFFGPKMTAELHIQETGSVELSGGNLDLGLAGVPGIGGDGGNTVGEANGTMSVSVPSGQLVQFQCEANGWFPEPAVDWLLSGKPLSRTNTTSTSIGETDRSWNQDQGLYNITDTLTLDLYRGLYNATSTLLLVAGPGSDGRVECRVSVAAMETPFSREFGLSIVAVVDEGTDETVVMVVCCVMAILLLLLITTGVLVYLRRRPSGKGPSHQDSVRIDHHPSEQNSVAEETDGTLNAGYSSEGLSSFIDTDFSVSTASRRNSASTVEVRPPPAQIPDVISSSELAYKHPIYYIPLQAPRPTTTRRQVTTV